VYLAATSATMGVLIGLGLGSIVLSPQVGGALVCEFLLVPVIFAGENLIYNGKPKEVHKEILSRFGDGYCGVVLFLLSFSIASVAIGVGIGAVTNAIFPGVMLPKALAAAAIGAIAPTVSFFITHHAIMPIAEKVNNYIIQPIVEKVKGCFSSQEA